ncbi:MAG: bifunctional (p)ppGpp synthetase/guanosine-3',5'-bis(diphosphate) 3'-pyrophosphohydrolase [Nitrospinae bacterium]|nr:bifunctional (p)ppGpp synthetase/guanosine-3',5'-bis(diphosphate) 3'-pyrophosphohydrolase [Nitrospinota bacterium]
MQAVKGIHLEDIIEALRAYQPNTEPEKLWAAYTFASRAHKGQVRLSGEPYMSHPMEVAMILARMKMDQTALVAGLLHDTLEDTDATAEKLEELFGPEVATLVEGLTKLGRISFSNREESQAENVRKMILAMSKDLRVVLIKLADRLHNMRTLDFLPPARQKSISQETMDIYAPLASRLGLHWIKVELEDGAFKYLYPYEYKRISDQMAERQEELDGFLVSVCNQTRELLLRERIAAQVTGRFKHFYGIYRKMKGQKLDFDQIYDLIGVRIITNSLLDCYMALGLVHNQWKPIPGKFKDYIALPKENLYRSIHSTVLTPTGRRVEFQFRTQQMHRHAEEGIAAHFRYKEGGRPSAKGDEGFIWVKRLLDLGVHVNNPQEFMDNLKMDLFPDEVYVFTPKQEVKAFPAGATPLDFAYAIHTQVGNHYLGSLINGKPVPMDAKLRNGDVVEILTSEDQHPTREWLKVAATSHARTTIKANIRNAEKTDSQRLGRQIVEQELLRHKIDPAQYMAKPTLENAAHALGFKSADTLIERLGSSTYSVYGLLQKLLPPTEWKTIEERRKNYLMDLQSDAGVKVGSMNDVMIRFAGCCNPVPGDPILGYLSAGHGLVIHNKSCPMIKVLESDPEKIVVARWDAQATKQLRPVRLLVYCLNQPGILARVSTSIAESNANISMASIAATSHMGGELDLTVEIEDLNHLQKIIEAIRRVGGVKSVERIMDASRAGNR